MDPFFAVITGIVSSLLATLLFLLARWGVYSHLLPWYQNFSYKGIRLDGRWVDQKEGDPTPLTMELSQSSNVVVGQLNFQMRPEDSPILYRVRGEIRDSYLSATLWPNTPHYLDTGALVVHAYCERGVWLKGVLAFAKSKVGGVESGQVLFKRAEA